MGVKQRVSVLVAIIGALGAIVAAFIGGSVYTTVTVRNVVESNQIVNIDNSGSNAADIALSLLEQNEQLYEKNLGLENEIQEVKREQSEGSSKADELQKQINELNKSNEELKAKNAKLEEENEKLKKKSETGTDVVIPEGGVPLASLNVFNNNSSAWKVNSDSRKDVLGHDYSSSESYIVAGNTSYRGAYAEYQLDGKYTKLSGYIAPHCDFSNNGSALVKVYGQVYKDGEYSEYKPLYTSKNIDAKTDIFSFEISEEKMKDVRFIKVEVDNSLARVLLTDWILS